MQKLLKSQPWPAVIAASSLVLVVLTLLDVSGPARAVAGLWFLLVCTGMSFLPLAGIRLRTPLELASIPMFSVVLDALVATGLTLLGVLSQTSALFALVGLSLIGCALQLRAVAAPQGTDPRQRLRSPAASGADRALSSPHR